MKPHRITVFLAAVAAAVSVGGTAATTAAASVHPRPDNGFIGTEFGTGPTLADAKWSAEAQMYGDYFGCNTPFLLVGDGQYADGTWWAELQADGCQGYN